MAGRIKDVGQMRVAAALPGPMRATALPPACLATVHDLAESVFGKGQPTARLLGPRTIISQRSRAVRVEVRRARAASQMELRF